jgi:carbon monoxide dehydrogenase subunit G
VARTDTTAVTPLVAEIDRHAPVAGSSEIEIAAAPEVAWEVLTAIDRWPTWNPAVKSVSWEGPIGVGSRFRWKAGPGTITSTIKDLEPPRRIAWTGTSFGINAIHVHTFEPRDGGTLVSTEESYNGFVARLFRRRLQKILDSALRDELQNLKAEAERRERPA